MKKSAMRTSSRSGFCCAKQLKCVWLRKKVSNIEFVALREPIQLYLYVLCFILYDNSGSAAP